MEELLYFHLMMIDKIIFISEEAVSLLQEDHKNLSNALDLLEQRSTVMDIIEHLQTKIEKCLKVKSESYPIEIENWHNETSAKYIIIDQLDQTILQELAIVKQEIAKEISSTVNNKNSIKGYNANSVK